MPTLRAVPMTASGTPSHEELLMRLYDRMLRWALRLTGKQREQAEDLVHDVFVQFTLSCEPESIANVEAYLYTMLKNPNFVVGWKLRLAKLRICLRRE